MTLLATVHEPLLRLENDLASMDLSPGTVGVWALHADDPFYRDLMAHALGEQAFHEVSDVVHFARDIPPMPGCYHGIVLSFERYDTRWFVAALRGGHTILVQRPSTGGKPKCQIVPPDALAIGPTEVVLALRGVINCSEPVVMDDHARGPRSMLEALMNALGIDSITVIGFDPPDSPPLGEL